MKDAMEPAAKVIDELHAQGIQLEIVDEGIEVILPDDMDPDDPLCDGKILNVLYLTPISLYLPQVKAVLRGEPDPKVTTLELAEVRRDLIEHDPVGSPLRDAYWGINEDLYGIGRPERASE